MNKPLVLGNNIPPYHTYGIETQDTQFAVPVPAVAKGWTELTKEMHDVLCKMQPGDSISFNRKQE